MLDDNALFRLWAEAAKRPRTPHLEASEWERLALHEMDAEERSRVLLHVTACASCTRTYRGLQALAAEARTFDAGVPALEVPRDTSRPPRWVLGGGLAAAAALAGWAVLRPLPAPVPPPETGGGEVSRNPPAAVRGEAAPDAPRPVAPSGRLTGAPEAFRWAGTDEARGYRVRLLRGDGEPLWTSPEVPGTELAWPAEVRPAPGAYLWRVEAVPRWGGAADAARSAFASFEITASPR
jgi:hypothetical protein